MRQMKNSGIEWVGDIPDSWKIERMKSCIISREGGAWGDEETGYNDTICLRIADFDYDRFVFKDTAISELTKRHYGKNTILKLKLIKGDILIEKSGGGEKTPVGRTVIFDKEYLAVFANFMDRLRCREFVYPKFMQYIFVTFYKNQYTRNYIKQTTGIQNLDLSLMLNKEHVPVPPVEEQKRIAGFLDKKCGEIDGLIADIKTQVQTLEQYKRSVITEAVTKGLNPSAEMKDSGIQWIGFMPTHWKTIRGKYLLKYLQKPVRKDDGVITCFRDGEVTLRSKRREEGFTMAEKEIGYQGVEIGDLVVHGMDGFAGAIGISDSRGKASPVLNVLDTEQNKKYIMYYLRSMAYSDVFMAMSTGIRVRSCDLRWNKLAELFYPVPPKEEQEDIVSFIDNKLKQTDDVIEQKQSQIETLESYKKSLIYEYVTGKKEVV